ncbi:hypothetical protein GALMADRAFT_212663 [Galerina marginata CBS 339.88]|uniref:DUF7223 domain-containing protein n=1 Tax=Galerina marginata (strain CBS 339.88) TaxID=685588 RepID=A0A067SQG8_GALM3|nr:hypothetical protein GALMADRAFT_212663 [Galerina marginata CBS 339.88]
MIGQNLACLVFVNMRAEFNTDLPASNGSASGTLKIWGSENAISDITPAAGWEIIDCSPDALQQDIRLVCKDDSSTDCAHLYDGSSANNNAAVGKVVRLPENCGKSAFAVITKAWTPQDQTIPANVASSLTRRDGAQPDVKGLHLDTSFSSVTPTSAGPVNFAIRAANVPGANGDLATTPQQQRRRNSRIFRRGISDFVSGAINDIASLNDFNVDQSKTLAPLDVDKSFNLVDKSISCPPVDASVKIDVDAKAHAVASIGVAASGLTAQIDGSVNMHATASGSLDSGKIKLFEVGIPGLDFPGILTLGPSFQINGQATANLDLNADMTVGISYKIDNAQLTFPPKKGSSGSFNIGNTPLKLSASPSAKATGTVEAHLIPTLNFGISALDNIVSANVFLALDASATMTLTAQAGANADATINPRSDLENTGKAARGYYFLSPPSLNSRQFDDSEDGDDGEDDSQDDSADNFDGSDDSSDASGGDEDGSQDDGSADAPVDDSSNDDNSTDPDTSADAGDDTDPDASVDAGDNSGDVSDDTGDDGSDTVDDGSDAVDDGSSDNVDDSNDDTSGDFSNANDNVDTSADGDNTDASDDTDNSDDADSASDDANDDTSAGANDGTSTDAADSSDTADSGDAATDGSDATDANTSDDSDPSTDSSTDSDNADSSAAASSSADASPSATATADDSAESAAATPAPKVALTTSTTFGGCFTVDSALDVNAGADGSFFGLFDKNTKVDLFNKKFELFKKCFGSNAATRRSIPELISRRPSRLFIPSRSVHLSLQQRAFGLTCPKAEAGAGAQQTITDQTVAASAVTKVYMEKTAV